jgi:hypothetical protein
MFWVHVRVIDNTYLLMKDMRIVILLPLQSALHLTDIVVIEIIEKNGTKNP